MKKVFCLLLLASFNVSNASVSPVFNKNMYFDSISFNDEKIILYYKDFDIYKDTFEWNNSEYTYIIDGNKNIMFFDSEGRSIDFDLNLIELKNYNLKFSDSASFSSSQAYVYSKVLDADKYDELPKPLLFNEDELFTKITTVLSNNSDFSVLPKESEGVTSFQFDIDENGEIIDAKYFSEVNVNGLEYVVKYLYKMEKWSPAKINGKPVKSTYEVKLYSQYNGTVGHADKTREKINSLR